MTTIEQLLAVQDFDGQISEHERELQDIPARKTMLQARLTEHKGAVAQARDALKEKQSQAKQLELEVETARQRILKLREQQMQLKTNKEFQTMEGEISKATKEIDGIESRILAALEEIDGSAAGVHKTEADLKAEEAEVSVDAAKMDERAKQIQARVDGLRGRRQELAKGVDATWLAAYERIMANKKDKALVSAENGVCGGCHLTLPPYIRHAAKKQAGIVVCEFCGRMLYG